MLFRIRHGRRRQRNELKHLRNVLRELPVRHAGLPDVSLLGNALLGDETGELGGGKRTHGSAVEDHVEEQLVL